MKYQHILWDWNGTLLDDVTLGVEIINGILMRRGMRSIDLGRYYEVFDFPVIDYYRNVGLDLDHESFEKIAEEYIVHYEERCCSCTLQENAKDVLVHIHGQGIPQSILSASHHESLRQFVDYFGIAKYFSDLIGLKNHYAESKIENGCKWMMDSGYGSKDVVMIGDTVHDYEVAQAIGADCILVSRGHHSEEKLKSCGVPVLSSLLELLVPGVIV